MCKSRQARHGSPTWNGYDTTAGGRSYLGTLFPQVSITRGLFPSYLDSPNQLGTRMLPPIDHCWVDGTISYIKAKPFFLRTPRTRLPFCLSCALTRRPKACSRPWRLSEEIIPLKEPTAEVLLPAKLVCPWKRTYLSPFIKLRPLQCEVTSYNVTFVSDRSARWYLNYYSGIL